MNILLVLLWVECTYSHFINNTYIFTLISDFLVVHGQLIERENCLYGVSYFNLYTQRIIFNCYALGTVLGDDHLLRADSKIMFKNAMRLEMGTRISSIA